MRKIFEFTMPDDSDDYKIYSQALKMHSIHHAMLACHTYDMPVAQETIRAEYYAF